MTSQDELITFLNVTDGSERQTMYFIRPIWCFTLQMAAFSLTGYFLGIFCGHLWWHIADRTFGQVSDHELVVAEYVTNARLAGLVTGAVLAVYDLIVAQVGRRTGRRMGYSTPNVVVGRPTLVATLLNSIGYGAMGVAIAIVVQYGVAKLNLGLTVENSHGNAFTALLALGSPLFAGAIVGSMLGLWLGAWPSIRLLFIEDKSTGSGQLQ